MRPSISLLSMPASSSAWRSASAANVTGVSSGSLPCRDCPTPQIEAFRHAILFPLKARFAFLAEGLAALLAILRERQGAVERALELEAGRERQVGGGAQRLLDGDERQRRILGDDPAEREGASHQGLGRVQLGH